jgi:hypothetical protein
VDKQLASGEYFLKEKEKRLKAQEEKKVRSKAIPDSRYAGDQ